MSMNNLHCCWFELFVYFQDRTHDQRQLCDHETRRQRLLTGSGIYRQTLRFGSVHRQRLLSSILRYAARHDFHSRRARALITGLRYSRAWYFAR